MLFKIDENLPIEFAEILVSSGYDARTVREQQLHGADDWAVMDKCDQEHRVLVTLDTDFSDITLYPPEEHEGIIVLRLGNQCKKHVLQTLYKILPVMEQEPNPLILNYARLLATSPMQACWPARCWPLLFNIQNSALGFVRIYAYTHPRIPALPFRDSRFEFRDAFPAFPHLRVHPFTLIRNGPTLNPTPFRPSRPHEKKRALRG